MRTVNISFSVCFVFMLFHPGCREQSVPAEEWKDPRTYQWAVDTIALPGSFQTSMSRIWGYSAENVYTVGHNFSPGPGTMYRFNGTTWNTTGFHTGEGGPITGALELTDIIGFLETEVWIVGARTYSNWNPPPNFLDSTLILQFNGNFWKEHAVPTGRGLECIGGTSSSDLWTGGADGTLYHYNGTVWKRHYLPVSYTLDRTFYIRDIDFPYMLCYKYDPPSGFSSSYILRYQNGEWTPMDSSGYGMPKLNFRWGNSDLWTSPQGTTYSCGEDGVFRLENGTWKNILKTDRSITRMSGTSDENIYAVGYPGRVYHFNGTDWHLFEQFNGLPIIMHSVWCDQKNVFAMGVLQDANFATKTVVLRGK